MSERSIFQGLNAYPLRTFICIYWDTDVSKLGYYDVRWNWKV